VNFRVKHGLGVELLGKLTQEGVLTSFMLYDLPGIPLLRCLHTIK